MNGVAMLMEERKWHEKNWIIVLLIFVFFPIGLFLFFKNKYYSITSKIIVITLIALCIVTSDNKSADNATQQVAVNKETSEEFKKQEEEKRLREEMEAAEKARKEKEAKELEAQRLQEESRKKEEERNYEKIRIKQEILEIQQRAKYNATSTILPWAQTIIQAIDARILEKSGLLRNSIDEEFEEHKDDDEYFKNPKVVAGMDDYEKRKFNERLSVLYLKNKEDLAEKVKPGITVEDFTFVFKDINKYAGKRIRIRNLLLEYTEENTFVEKLKNSYGALMRGKNCYLIAAVDKPFLEKNEIYSFEGYIAGVHSTAMGTAQFVAALEGKTIAPPPMEEDPPIFIVVGNIVED